MRMRIGDYICCRRGEECIKYTTVRFLYSIGYWFKVYLALHIWDWKGKVYLSGLAGSLFGFQRQL